MNENLQKQNYSNDEFDIEVLAEKLWRINMRFWQKIFYPVKVLLRNPVRLIIFSTIAVFLAVIGRYTLPATYKSSFAIVPHNQTDYTYLNMLNDLKILIKDKNYPDIAKRLHIDEASSEKISDLENIITFRNKAKKDTIEAVEIILYLKDATLIDTLQQHIFKNYLIESKYYQKRQTLLEQELNALEIRLVEDLRENDSLKNIVTRNSYPRNAGGFVYGEPIDPLKIYQSGLTLYEHLIKVRTQKQYTECFELSKPGIVRLKPYFPRIIFLLPVTLFIFLTICFVMNKKEMK